MNPIVVFGAGQIGEQVTQRLVAQGVPVRQVRRSGAPGQAGLVERRVGDLRDVAFAREVALGARALIHCAVPAYHRWHTELEPMNDAVLAAAKASGAPLVVLDNLYPYGRPRGPLTEQTPLEPCSRKGALRARLAVALQEAHARGDAKVSIARAADFYGPHVSLSGVFGERFTTRAQRGKNAECFGPPGLLHSYSFAPDVAAGLVTLALRPEQSLGEVWHLPVAPAESTEAVVARFARALGVPLQTEVVPGWALHLMGLFVPAVKELLEMRYQWEVPFVLDDTKFRRTFGGTATSLDEGVRQTVAWWRTRA